jgi:hypothetical protein
LNLHSLASISNGGKVVEQKCKQDFGGEVWSRMTTLNTYCRRLDSIEVDSQEIGWMMDGLIWLRVQKMEGSCGHGVEAAGFMNATG